MARMHSSGKGKSLAMKPFSTYVPTNMVKSVAEMEKDIIHLSKRGNGASAIGKLLRDNYGVGNVSDVLGMTLIAFLRKNNAAPVIPEDLNALMDKANEIRHHLVSHRNDNNSKYRLNLVNSRLHRLLRYYKETGVVAASWKPKKI